MAMTTAAASLPEGAIPELNGTEVDAGAALPVAYEGMRRILAALGAEHGDLRKRFLAEHPVEWKFLFPHEVEGAGDLSDLALTPSERRLHRESEQTFWVLNTAADFIVQVLKHSRRTLVVRNSGEADLVTLRGLMRAVEWARLEGIDGRIVLADWGHRRRRCAARFAPRRDALMESMLARMRMEGLERGPTKIVDRALSAPVDAEGRYVAEVARQDAPPERRLAAAVLAVRSCFFSTNYEGAMFAVEQALALLDAVGDRVDEAALTAAWDELDTGQSSPAIEVDRASLGNAQELRALFHRSSGVVNAFVGEFDEALADFARGLECRISPERQGQLRMFRALNLIKRLGNIEKARAEIDAGLQAVAQTSGEARLLHEGWLRNVLALTYFQEKQLEAAVTEEKQAIRCVGELHDPSATHLKINLISNLSVVQETAKRYDDSIATWRRFEKISANWGENFHKHHRYRLAGLTLAAGRIDEAVEWYTGSYQAAEKLGDQFHRQVIAAELGRLHLDREQKTQALAWFEKALVHARSIGCPLRVGESLAGLTLAQGGADFSAAASALRTGSSYPDATAKLQAALATGDAAAVQAALPRPRSKLNRPFDLVNLY
jgi:tetratricopeptide (TPR) repeat protein